MEEIRCKKEGDTWPIPPEIKSFKFKALMPSDGYSGDIIILAEDVVKCDSTNQK